MPEVETPTETTVETTPVETTVDTAPVVETPAVGTKEKPTPAASETTAREKLETSVRDKLAAMNSDDDEPDADAQAGEPGEGAVSTNEPAKAKEAAAVVTPAAPTLPAAHVRSLKAYDWTDEEIADAAKSPNFAATAAKIHANRNKEITAWAEAGRKAKEAIQTQAAPPVTVTQPAVQQQPKKLDIAALKQQYGDEPLIAALEQQEAELSQFRTFRQHHEAQAQRQHLETLSRQIDGFFSGKELEPYRDNYGTTSATLTPQQSEKRAEVLRLADAIVGGAKQSGHQLSLDQALQHAFDSVSAPIAKQAARQEIKNELQTRGKGITLKPGTRTTPPQAKTRGEMEKNVRTKLRSVFG